MTSAPLGIDRWRQLVREFEGTALTQREFAEAKGITASALAYWRRRLASEPAPPPSTSLAVSFVEVRPETPAPALPTVCATYGVGLRNGRTISVPPTFDDQVLERLIIVVEGGA
jgi:transcriptional regulator with XRE-family HTH domain